ncbi:hypothetical protein ACFL0H_04610, partial [Thermodesulfobacteriota bacterium]
MKIAQENKVRVNAPLKFNYFTDKKKIFPFLVWILLIATSLAHVGSVRVFGYKIAGWAWLIPSFIALIIIVKSPKRVVFPWVIWVPWIILIYTYLLVSPYNVLQRTVQLTTPLIIGMAISTYQLKHAQILKFLSIAKWFSIIFFMLALYQTGTLMTGKIPNVTGLAGHSITIVLMCCLFAASYAFLGKEYFKHWLLMALYTFFSMVRITIIAA